MIRCASPSAARCMRTPSGSPASSDASAALTCSTVYARLTSATVAGSGLEDDDGGGDTRVVAEGDVRTADPEPVGLAWHDAEIVSEETGRPRFDLRGTVAARAEALGAAHVHVSLSHDAGIASAVVVLEG